MVPNSASGSLRSGLLRPASDFASVLALAIGVGLGSFLLLDGPLHLKLCIGALTLPPFALLSALRPPPPPPVRIGFGPSSGLASAPMSASDFLLTSTPTSVSDPPRAPFAPNSTREVRVGLPPPSLPLSGQPQDLHRPSSVSASGISDLTLLRATRLRTASLRLWMSQGELHKSWSPASTPQQAPASTLVPSPPRSGLRVGSVEGSLLSSPLWPREVSAPTSSLGLFSHVDHSVLTSAFRISLPTSAVLLSLSKFYSASAFRLSLGVPFTSGERHREHRDRRHLDGPPISPPPSISPPLPSQF